MFRQNKSNEESLPSWLKESNSGKSTTAKSPKSKSAANQSYGTTNAAVTEFYGHESTPMPPYSPPPPPVAQDGENAEPSWLDSTRDEGEEEESEEEESEEEESEEDEEESEEESSEEEFDDDWEEGSENEKLVKNKRAGKSSNPRNMKPRRNCCHSFFILIQIIAVLVNLTMFGVQLVPIYTWHKMIIEEKVVRCYLAVFDLLFILAEFDVSFVGFKNWIIRGILYSFVGVMALDQRQSMIKFGFLNTKTDTSFSETWNELWTSIIIQATSWAMIGTGCFYILLEIFCMRGVRNRCRADYQKKLAKFNRRKKR